MTLTTAIRIVEPTAVRPVFTYARHLLGGELATFHERAAGDIWRDATIAHDAGQGLPALLWVHYGGDGPLHVDHEDWECEESRHHCPPAASIEVNFDTAYGYTAENGARCVDLHAWLVREMGEWLDSRGLTWWWHDEMAGEWHRGEEGLAELGAAEKGRPPIPATI